LNSKLNIERNHEFYVDKFKIILELMRGGYFISKLYFE
jgi:hypothetical protein